MSMPKQCRLAEFYYLGIGEGEPRFLGRQHVLYSIGAISRKPTFMHVDLHVCQVENLCRCQVDDVKYIE